MESKINREALLQRDGLAHGGSFPHALLPCDLRFAGLEIICSLMARPLRIEHDGVLYNITTQGDARQDIFYRDKGFQISLEILSETTDRYRWIIHAYFLTSNLCHLSAEPPLAHLSFEICHLHGLYTHRFNGMIQGTSLGTLMRSKLQGMNAKHLIRRSEREDGFNKGVSPRARRTDSYG